MATSRKKGLSSLKIRPPKRIALTRPSAPRPDKVEDAPVVGGMIQGKKASAPEVVLSRILDRYKKQYAFRWTIPVVPETYGLRGEREVDFVISDGTLKPVQVADFEFIHRSPEQQQKDSESDIVVNRFFKEFGGVPVVWIDAVNLIDNSMADNTAKRLGLV